MSPNDVVRGRLQAIAAGVAEKLPPGWGLALFVFPMDGREGNINYISSAEREDIMAVMRTWLEKNQRDKTVFGRDEEGPYGG